MSTTLDKTMTEDEVVSRLESGMTIGIGGWAARRKPMSIIRAIVRSDLTDLTVAAYGGADVGMLCAAGKVSTLVSAFVSLDSIPLEPHYRKARQSSAVTERPMDEGMFLLALQAAAWRVPFLPTRVGLGSDLFRDDPSLKTVTSPYPSPDGTDAEELVAVPALHLDTAIVHLNRCDARGNAAFLGPDLYFDDLLLEAADAGYVSCEKLVTTEELADEAPLHAMRTNRMFVTGVVEVAVAEAFRGNGEILANPIGTIPMIGGRLARATFEPALMMTDGEARLIAGDRALGDRAVEGGDG